MYKYRTKIPIRLFDKSQESQQYNRVEDVTEISDEFVSQLNADKYSWDEFRFQSAFDIGSSDDLDYILSRLAASYVTVAEHLNTHFSGIDLESHMNQLEVTVSNVINQKVNCFAENVGGFLEKNGFANEREKIYNTIAEEYANKIWQYSEFVKKNGDYMHLKGSDDEWLLNDVAYMAQELRKACNTSRDAASLESGYSLKELSLANRLVGEMKFEGLFDSSGNEESFGLGIGILLLKTQLFTENNKVSEQLAGKMWRAVKKGIDDSIDKVNNRILSLYDDPYYDKERAPIYNKSEIYDVCKIMLDIYKEKGSYSETILESINYARNKSRSKENINGIVDRYKLNYYWKRFYDNSDCFQKFYYSKEFDRRTSYQKLVDSWNAFAFDVSKCDNYQIKKTCISVLA